MPSSFDALQEETRPLRLMAEQPAPSGRPGVALASLLLIVLPVLAAILL